MAHPHIPGAGPQPGSQSQPAAARPRCCTRRAAARAPRPRCWRAQPPPQIPRACGMVKSQQADKEKLNLSRRVRRERSDVHVSPSRFTCEPITIYIMLTICHRATSMSWQPDVNLCVHAHEQEGFICCTCRVPNTIRRNTYCWSQRKCVQHGYVSALQRHALQELQQQEVA